MRQPSPFIATAGTLALALAAAAPATPALAADAVDQENVAFTAGNGLSSEYHVYAEGVPQPAGLLIWTHGDGAYEFHNPDSDYVMGGPQGVRALAKEQGYIVVSALSPDRDGTTTWWEDGEDNADYFADLITHLVAEYGIDESDVVLAGFSGGAQFTTMYFLPAHSDMLQGGGSIVFGGGGPPYEDPEFNEDLKSTFSMHWATGELDDLEHSDEGYDALCYAREGVAYYSAAGFDTSYHWIEGRDHVIDGLFGEIVAGQLRSWADGTGGGTPGTPGTPTDPAPRPTVPGTIDGATGWPAELAFDPVGYAYLTVDIPEGTTGSTTVRVDGTDGTYWYQIKTADQEPVFRMGDPCDYLSSSTTYTYRVTNGGTTHATGSFTTPEFTGPVDPPTDPTDPEEPVVAAPVNVEPPRVDGEARVGRTLRATDGAWDAAEGAEVTYARQWLRNGEPIAGATGETYRVTAADRGARLSVEVVATAATSAGSASATARSAEVAVTVPAVVSGRVDRVVVQRGTPVTATVAVRPIGADVVPGGEVAIDVAGQRHTAELVDGSALVTLTGLPRGLHVLTASYAGDGTVRPAFGWVGLVLVL